MFHSSICNLLTLPFPLRQTIDSSAFQPATCLLYQPVPFSYASLSTCPPYPVPHHQPVPSSPHTVDSSTLSSATCTLIMCLTINLSPPLPSFLATVDSAALSPATCDLSPLTLCLSINLSLHAVPHHQPVPSSLPFQQPIYSSFPSPANC